MIKSLETYNHHLKDYNREIQWWGAQNKNNWIIFNKLSLMGSRVLIVRAEDKLVSSSEQMVGSVVIT